MFGLVYYLDRNRLLLFLSYLFGFSYHILKYLLIANRSTDKICSDMHMSCVATQGNIVCIDTFPGIGVWKVNSVQNQQICQD